MANTQIITLNQLIENIKVFTNNHLQINDFGYGPTSDIGTSRQMKFPYLWATHTGPSTVSTINRTSIPTIQLGFIIVDQINIQKNHKDINGNDSNNTQEIVSDMHQIGMDLIIFLTTELNKLGVKLVDDSVSFDVMIDETVDKVAGWLVTLDLQLTHSNCVYPGKGVLVPPTSSCKPVTVTDGGNDIIIQSGGTYTCIGATSSGIQYDRPTITGQLISYTLYDDAWQTTNGIKDYSIEPTPTHTARLDTSSSHPFTTLVNNSVFGNKNRFTTNTGTQDYTDIGGGVTSDGSIADYIVCNLTGIGISRIDTGGSDFDTNCLNAFNSTVHGFTDWHAMDRSMVNTFTNLHSPDLAVNDQYLNYSPLDYGFSIWLTTTRTKTTTRGYALSVGADSHFSKGTSLRGLYWRKHF